MRRALLAVLVAAVVVVPAARAATGAWTPFQEGDLGSSAYLGLHRTPDGVLHAVWERADRATNTTDILERTVSPAGDPGATVRVVNWPGTSAPDVAANPGGGLLALWGGLKPGNVESGSATAPDDGAAWTEGPEPIDRGRQVYASPLAIESGSDGTVFEAWTATLGTWVHRGTDRATPSFNYQAQLGGLAFSAPNLARDGADGSLWLGWPVFDANQNNGAWVQQVDGGTGAPVGSPIKVPGSSLEQNGQTSSYGTLGRWPITGRPGRAGVFVAAPVANDVIFWRVGQPNSITLDSGSGRHRQVAVAADSDGRIIVFWGTDAPGTKLFARVSDPDVTSFAPAFEIPLPPGASSTLVWGLAASAQSGGLFDLFVDASIGGEAHYWHTQGLPPPVLGKAVNARVVSGEIFVKLPGARSFARVGHDTQIPVGATVDARKGRVRITTALPGGKLQSGDFFQGVFRVTQARNGLATMALTAGNFGICGNARRGASPAKVRSVRKLWGDGAGRFRTTGRYAAATIRGTTWLTDDRCDGTLIRVTRGSVTVRDLVRRRNVVVTKGQSYLAKARR
jgi:hypothetical protein